MKRIAFICYKGFGADGISSFIINNYRQFDHSEIKCSLIYPRIIGEQKIASKYLTELTNNGDNTYLVPKKGSIIKYFFNLKSILSTGKYDVAHIHGSSGSIVLEMFAAKCAGIKHIIPHSHNTTGNHVLLHKMCMPFVKHLSSIRLSCGIDAGKWMYGKSSFYVIPNGINIEKYCFSDNIRTQTRKELGIRDDELIIGHVGGFNHQKNQEFLIRFAAYVKRNLPCFKFHLLLIGKGYRQIFNQNLAKDLQVDSCVSFLGQRTDVANLFQAMDVFFLPSLFEGFPIVGIEAQAAGLPTFMSCNITKDAELTDLVKWLPIDKGFDCWLQALQSTKINNESRALYAYKVAQKGFNIKEAAKVLEKVYLNNKGHEFERSY